MGHGVVPAGRDPGRRADAGRHRVDGGAGRPADDRRRRAGSRVVTGLERPPPPGVSPVQPRVRPRLGWVLAGTSIAGRSDLGRAHHRTGRPPCTLGPGGCRWRQRPRHADLRHGAERAVLDPRLQRGVEHLPPDAGVARHPPAGGRGAGHRLLLRRTCPPDALPGGLSVLRPAVRRPFSRLRAGTGVAAEAGGVRSGTALRFPSGWPGADGGRPDAGVGAADGRGRAPFERDVGSHQRPLAHGPGGVAALVLRPARRCGGDRRAVRAFDGPGRRAQSPRHRGDGRLGPS